ncbi:MAG TPA: lamin tail domain-containing protein, partial [Candidatus Binatia bacterium]|nr:lamin tail domain-containing protein [Candidatus Binatia bacterium]
MLAPKPWLLSLLFALLPPMATGRVVINEIFYNAPDDITDLEYIELHNSSGQPVDLGGWALTKGVKFNFPTGTRIEANGFLVLCRNRERFQQFYDAPLAGVFSQHLSKKGERLELCDPSGRMMDAVKYSDDAPWPVGANGYSGSLERISPEASGEDPFNWTSSPLSKDRLKPAGTPGRINANYCAQLPPTILEVKWAPENPAPEEPMTVEALVRDSNGVSAVSLFYRLAGPGFEKPESSVPMQKISEGRYSAAIPGQAADQLIRFRVQGMGTSGARRYSPAETEPRPAFSCYVHGRVEPAKIPFGWIIHTVDSEFKAARQRAQRPEPGGPGEPGRGARGPGMFLAPRVLSAADKNRDRKLTP